MKSIRELFLVISLAIPAIALAQSPAVIRSVTPSGGALTIAGDNFIQPRGRYDVLLGNMPLVPTSYTADTIVAPLPGPLAVGTYLLQLVPQRGNAIPGDEFAYVVAATGAKGDKGDKGDAGATGPQGPMGQTGLTGSTGLQGPQGLQGSQGIQGPMGFQGPQGPPGTTGQRMLTLRTDGNAAVHLQGNSVEFLRGTVNVTQPADLFYMFTGRAVWGGQPCIASVSVHTDLTPDVFFTAVNLNDTTNSALIVQGSVPVPGPRAVTVWAVAAGATNCHIFVAEPALTLMVLGN
jgi:hypothetical protein